MGEEVSMGGITLTWNGPGDYSVSGSGTFTMVDAPYIAMALEQLRQAMAIQARIAREGIPDLGKWRGAFEMEPDPNAR